MRKSGSVFRLVASYAASVRVPISLDDLPIIQRERYYHPQPHIMMRMHTLALHHEGESAARIA